MSNPTHRRTVAACSVPYGSGGLGQHFAQVVDEARTRGDQVRCYSSGEGADRVPSTLVIRDRLGPLLVKYTPLRFDPGAINHFENERFDAAAASRLRLPLDCLMAFGGQSLHLFRRARELGARELILIAANSHVKNVARRHARSIEACPVEKGWLNEHQIAKTLLEYEAADRILIASQYSWDTFIDGGVPEHKLHRIHYLPRARFVPATGKVDDGVFRVVYLGSITVMKGVPALIEAFSRVPDPKAELILVGGTATRGMKRYLAEWMARDSRIRLAPGDPLPHLQRASVCVHPTYEDNLAYAGLEAMACGVPVVVTADTGMKEYVQEGVNGYIVPTGDWHAILDRLVHLREHPLVIREPFRVGVPQVGAAS